MIAFDISREEKQQIAADKRQNSPLAASLADARARLVRLDEQIAVLDTHLNELRAQLGTAAYRDRSALREEIGDLEREISSLRAQRPELERTVDQLATRVEMEVRAGILAAQRTLERAREA